MILDKGSCGAVERVGLDTEIDSSSSHPAHSMETPRISF